MREESFLSIENNTRGKGPEVKFIAVLGSMRYWQFDNKFKMDKEVDTFFFLLMYFYHLKTRFLHMIVGIIL